MRVWVVKKISLSDVGFYGVVIKPFGLILGITSRVFYHPREGPVFRHK